MKLKNLSELISEDGFLVLDDFGRVFDITKLDIDVPFSKSFSLMGQRIDFFMKYMLEHGDGITISSMEIPALMKILMTIMPELSKKRNRTRCRDLALLLSKIATRWKSVL